jgi:hypothetical protein
MKKLIIALFVVAAAAFVVAPAYATELWDPHLRGLDEGLAAGALPPPGVYFINNSYFAPSYNFAGTLRGESLSPSGHENSHVKLFAYVDVPVLLWNPGCKFLGADYAMAIAEPFDYTNFRIANATHPPTYVGGAQWGAYNTIIIPYALSWKLPCDFYIKQALAVALNDGTESPGQIPADQGIFAESSNGYYSFIPELGLSWLHQGWNVSIDFYYAFNLKNPATDYQSGQQLAIDYTVTKTCGKWTFGIGAAEENQITTDSQYGNTIPDSKANAWTLGPIIGYNFGPCSVQFIYNFPLYTNNDVGGEWFDVRFVVPLWK